MFGRTDGKERMPADIVIIDYHKGNIASVERGLREAGATAHISDDPEVIRQADALVLPGVGSFGDAMAYLRESGEADAILEAVAAGKPFLGICLGLQLLFDWGTEGGQDAAVADEEGKIAGLGILRGHCDELPRDTGLKVPHVGWDQACLTQAGRENPFTSGVAEGTNFYFTHSYAVYADDPADVLATTDYAREFPCVVGRGNVFATQFHPEKSSEKGRAMLRAFVSIVDERA